MFGFMRTTGCGCIGITYMLLMRNLGLEFSAYKRRHALFVK